MERTVSVGANATLIYLHGGAYGRGSAYGYRGVVGRLAEAAWMAVVLPDYSSVSEAVALEELVEVYSALLSDGMDPQTIVIAGGSAGGGLALALAMTLRDRGIALPGGIGFDPSGDHVGGVSAVRGRGGSAADRVAEHGRGSVGSGHHQLRHGCRATAVGRAVA